MKQFASIFLCLILCIIFWTCAANNSNNTSVIHIPYPQPTPDSTAIPFLPTIVSKEGLDFNSAFSPDGMSYYFTRSKNGQWDIYVTTHDGNRWSEPTIAPFSDNKYSEADPAFAPDGRLFFISNRPNNTIAGRSGFDIWFIHRLPNGEWSAPENCIEINSDSAEYYISFSTNGNLYFGSSRQGGFGLEDIYVSRYIHGKYAAPENLGPTINSSESEHDPCVSEQEDFIVFKSENRNDGFGEADLYCSKRINNKWTEGVNLGSIFNTKTYEYCPYLSPDSKYFFFSSEYDIKWIDAQFLRNHIDKLCKE